MKQVILRELSVDFDQNMRNLLEESGGILKSLTKFSTVLIKEMDIHGNYVSQTPVISEMARRMNRLIFIAGKIESMRHLCAPMDTVLNCYDAEKMERLMNRLIFIAGKIESMSHLCASMDTVLNCYDAEKMERLPKRGFS